MAEVMIALGSNVGDGLATMAEAVRGIAEVVRVDAVSPVYRTAPMIVTDQPPFLNAALRGESHAGPLPILHALKRIEVRLGRVYRQRFGPREIDLDLIAYGTLRYDYGEAGEPVLRVPHPRAAERRFVLAPLADVAPDFVLQGFGRIADLLSQTECQARDVVRVEDALLPLPRDGS